MGILITGAGMVGSHLAQLLSEENDGVTLFELAPVLSYVGKLVNLDKVKLIRGDVTNLPDLIGAIQQSRVKCIVHTAALLGAAVDSAPYTASRVNVDGTVNVMEAARLTGVRRVVYTSTMGVYDWVASGPMTEEQRLGPHGLYGVTKLAAEQIALKYGERYGVEVVVLRYAVAYGYTFSAAGSIYGSVINTLLEKVSRGEPVVVQRARPFLNLNEFVYVRDMARAAALAVHAQDLKDRVYNIGTGELSDLTDLAAAVRSELPGAQITIEEPFGPLQHNPSRFPYDLGRAQAQLGYKPAYPLPMGVRNYLTTMAAVQGGSFRSPA
jgi:nucleoside-diphosphate-sugar epimerase